MVGGLVLFEPVLGFLAIRPVEGGVGVDVEQKLGDEEVEGVGVTLEDRCEAGYHGDWGVGGLILGAVNVRHVKSGLGHSQGPVLVLDRAMEAGVSAIKEA
eukprot:scaffold78048_cov45-Cyclotella_meneghiniana.AAC.1